MAPEGLASVSGWLPFFAGVLFALFVSLGVRRGLAARSAATIVWEGSTGLRYRNGKFAGVLAPGRYPAPLFGHQKVVVVSDAPVRLDGVLVEVLSRDQFSFCVTLSARVVVTDARAFHEAKPPLPAYVSYEGSASLQLERLTPILSAVLLRGVAQLTLEKFMAGPLAVTAGVLDGVRGALPGGQVDELLVTQITMPPEVRKMFTEVERARREGLASLERARAEQASLRALANAARALASNPGLAQLRQLQAMEKARGAKTFILRPPAADGSAGAAAGDMSTDD